MQQLDNDVKFDTLKGQKNTTLKIKNECFLKQKDITAPHMPTMDIINAPVYGHLVTADQLNQIEQRNGLLGFHHGHSETGSIGSSSFSVCETSSDHFLCNNLINEPMEVVSSHGNGPSETKILISNHSSSSVSGYESISTDTYSDKLDKAASNYHYPDLSNYQSTIDGDRLYVNTFVSNAQHNFARVPNTSHCDNSSHGQINNAKFASTIEKSHVLHHMEIDKCPNHHIILKMSVNLIKTYKQINEIYYRKKRRLKELYDENYVKNDHKIKNDNDNTINYKSAQNILNSDASSNNKGTEPLNEHLNTLSSIDESNTNQKLFIHKSNVPHANVNNSSNKDLTPCEYHVKAGEIWYGQYCIEKLIGTGSFGQVVRAKDLKSGEYVAIKIIKNRRSFVEQAYIEIDLLQDIGKYQENDDIAQETGVNYIVKLKSYFNHCGHLCLVFELLTYTLYDLLKNTNFRGVSLNLTRKFAQQICQALLFLSRPQVQIIHCDLKPENILLIHPRRSAIKVVDFGSSCHTNQRIYYYIQSRFYRSPEIILNLEYSHAIDMWSLGCIMAELHSGQPLFIGQFEHEQILRIIEVVGMPPNQMIDNGKKSLLYFERFPSLRPHTKFVYKPKLYRERDGKKISFQGVSSRALSDIIGVYSGGPQGRRLNEPGHSSGDYEKFLDLLQRMLVIDPNERIRPEEALDHPFFVRSSQQANSSAKNTTKLSSTSRDKTTNTMAASSTGKLSSDISLCVQTPIQNPICCDSNLINLVHPESNYLALQTVTTIAN